MTNLKLRVTMTIEMNIQLEHYPGAETVEDCARIQQEHLENGVSAPEEILACGFVKTKVEPA